MNAIIPLETRQSCLLGCTLRAGLPRSQPVDLVPRPPCGLEPRNQPVDETGRDDLLPRRSAGNASRTVPEMSEPATFGETEIDWNETTLFMRHRLTRKLGRVDELTLEDLTQEACVRLLRAVRRESATNPHALMTTIADRTAISYIRRITRERPIFEPLTEVTENLPDPKSETQEVPGDIQERVELVVQEVFRSRRSSCLELAMAFFEKRNWSAVADALGISHDAVRARWSRCVALLRKVVTADPEFRLLADWVAR